MKAAFGFSAEKADTSVTDEGYHHLVTIFAKNKYGYNTRFMSDFDMLLEATLNERWLEASTLYYDNEMTALEIEDQEAGLAGEFTKADIANLLKDKQDHDHSSYKALRNPDRVGTNYDKGDALSPYKILPKKA